MPIGLGPWELIIILLIVVVIFGAGRLADIGGALGKGIKEFRSATKDETGADQTVTTVATAPAPAVGHPSPTTTTVVTPVQSASVTTISGDVKCGSCGTVNPATQTFCGQCGQRLASRVA